MGSDLYMARHEMQAYQSGVDKEALEAKYREELEQKKVENAKLTKENSKLKNIIKAIIDKL